MEKWIQILDPSEKIYPDPDPGDKHFFKFDEPFRDQKILNDRYFFNSYFLVLRAKVFVLHLWLIFCPLDPDPGLGRQKFCESTGSASQALGCRLHQIKTLIKNRPSCYFSATPF